MRGVPVFGQRAESGRGWPRICILRRAACLGLVLVLLAGARAAAAAEFVGTTPCGAVARDFLAVPGAEKCDLIKWQLDVSPEAEAKTYKLTATYGLLEPSGQRLVGGGTTVTLAGVLNVRKGARHDENAAVYEIRHPESKAVLRFALLNDNLIHLMDREGALVAGNEFWSYTLNRKGVGGTH